MPLASWFLQFGWFLQQRCVVWFARLAMLTTRDSGRSVHSLPFRREACRTEDNLVDASSVQVSNSPVAGRPFTTSKGSLLAPARLGVGDCTWLAPAGNDSRPGVSLAAPHEWRQEFAEATSAAWLRHGQEEHASIASFARFSLDLLRFAAPPELILAAQSAGADEVRHARHAFQLASLFSDKHAAEVGAFPVEAAELASSLDSFTIRTGEEGCRGEGHAVARLVYALDNLLPGSPARAVLQELLADEARHAALAWATVRWAVGRGARPVLQNAPQQSEGSHHSYVTSEALPLTLVWAGEVPQETASELAAVVDSAWVAAWAANLALNGKVAALPTELPLLPAGPVGDAVRTAARLVRSSLELLESPRAASVAITV